MKSERSVVFILIISFFVLLFVAGLFAKTNGLSLIGETRGRDTLLDDAVTFLFQSAFTLQPEAAEWAVSAKGCDSKGPVNSGNPAEPHQ